MTWEQAEQAAFAWHDAMKAAETSDVEEDENDRELYMDLGGGNAWWSLTGESCLNREGDLMGHCVADYLDDVQDGDTLILSLRDAKNQPHATIELNEEYSSGQKLGNLSIAQVKGKENKPPVEKYWKYIDEVIKKLGSGVELGVIGEGHTDLKGCDILELGKILVRTDPSLDDADCILNVVQYPKDDQGQREWSAYDHEQMPLWEALQDLKQRDMLPEETHNYGYDMRDDSQKVNQYIKWVLIRDKEFEVETKGFIDEAFFSDNPDFRRSDLTREDEVHTYINIKVPDMKYEILSGSPEEFKFDVKHALAVLKRNHY